MDEAQILRSLEEASAAQVEGRYGDAQLLYQAILKADSQNLRAHYAYACLFRKCGHPAQAEQILLRAVALAPHFGEAWLVLALVYKEAGHWGSAVLALAKVGEFLPQHLAARKLHAELLLRLGRNQEALDLLQALEAQVPEDAEVLNNLAVALRMLARHEESERRFRRCLAMRPEHPDTMTNLADVLTSLKQWEEAEALLRRSLELQPNTVSTLNNLGIVLSCTDRSAEALAVFEEVLRLNPSHANSLMNKGCVLFSEKRMGEALACYEEAQRMAPEDLMVNYNLGTSYLRLGRFQAGWRFYESRLRMDLINQSRNQSPLCLKPGQDLQGKRLLLYAEQGLGDSIQFLRYATLFQKAGAKVLVELQPPLLPLAEAFEGVETVIARGDPVPPYDLHCSLLSAAFYFGTRLDSIPSVPRAWQAPAFARERWARQHLGPRRMKVGLVWAGNPEHANDHRRSLSLEPLLRLVRELADHVDFIVLQKTLRSGEAELLAKEPNILNVSAQLESFADTAALLERVDLLVSVDTSVVHLAGSMGRPAWLLLPFLSDWRWLDDRDDSPWYPSLRLWRQPRIGAWDAVLTQVKEGLRNYSAAPLASLSTPLSTASA